MEQPLSTAHDKFASEEQCRSSTTGPVQDSRMLTPETIHKIGCMALFLLVSESLLLSYLTGAPNLIKYLAASDSPGWCIYALISWILGVCIVCSYAAYLYIQCSSVFVYPFVALARWFTGSQVDETLPESYSTQFSYKFGPCRPFEGLPFISFFLSDALKAALKGKIIVPAPMDGSCGIYSLARCLLLRAADVDSPVRQRLEAVSADYARLAAEHSELCAILEPAALETAVASLDSLRSEITLHRRHVVRLERLFKAVAVVQFFLLFGAAREAPYRLHESAGPPAAPSATAADGAGADAARTPPEHLPVPAPKTAPEENSTAASHEMKANYRENLRFLGLFVANHGEWISAPIIQLIAQYLGIGAWAIIVEQAVMPEAVELNAADSAAEAVYLLFDKTLQHYSGIVAKDDYLPSIDMVV